MAFAALYVMALGVLLVGTIGLLGNEPDPLSGVFLIPMGLPWNLFVTAFPEPFLFWLSAGAPALNLVILFACCRSAFSRKPDN